MQGAHWDESGWHITMVRGVFPESASVSDGLKTIGEDSVGNIAPPLVSADVD